MKLFFNFQFGEPNIESERGDDELETMISKEKATKSDWVLVEFATKRCIKYYAGNIATVLRDEKDGDFVCNFLQKKANNQFIWPEQKDQSIIDVSQIKMFLPRPNDLMWHKYKVFICLPY